MNKAYNKINGGKGWKDYPSVESPVNANNLNKVDIGLDEVDNRVITLDTTKATKTEVAPLIKEIEFNESNGIFTITRKNGSKFTIDTKIEKIAINFGYDPVTQRISLTLIDGTVQYIDLSALITQYEFMDTDTVSFFIDENGKISAIVKEGSIQEKHLRPDYLADIKVEVEKAEASATAAGNSQTAAKASENNAKKSEINARESRDAAAESAADSADSAHSAAESAISAAGSAATATQKAVDAGNSASSAATSETNAANSKKASDTSAASASSSASSAASSATSAETYAKKSQSYAVGTGGVRPNEATDNAKYYYEQSRDISQGLAGALIPMGTVTFANLPALANAESGWMYNISDQFTTTVDFKEGAGNVIPAGANVYKTADGYWDVLAGTPVSGVKGEAESVYRTGNINLTPQNIGAVSKTGDRMTGDLLMTSPNTPDRAIQICSTGLQSKTPDGTSTKSLRLNHSGGMIETGGILHIGNGLSVNNGLLPIAEEGRKYRFIPMFNSFTDDPNTGGIVKFAEKKNSGLAPFWHWVTGEIHIGKYYKITVGGQDTDMNIYNWMISFELTVYQSYRYCKFAISGFIYKASTSTPIAWYEPRAEMIAGDREITNRYVYFGKDENNHLYVAIDALMYTGIVIDSINISYNDIVPDYSSLFSLSLESTLDNTTKYASILTSRPFHFDEANELKNSVSDGKAQVASAITAKGSYVAATASFQTMANLINGLWQGEVRARIVDSFMVTVDVGQSYKRDGGLKTVPANKKMIEILLITVACEGNDAYIAPHITWTVGGTNPLCTGTTVLGYNDFTHGSAYPCLMTYARRRIVESASQNETTLETSCNIYFGQTSNIVNKIMLSVSYLVFY